MGIDLIEHAEEYISLGLRVIALTGKAPNTSAHRRGLYDALGGPEWQLITTDHEAILKMKFRHAETTGIGILTGPVYYVVDIDGEEGAVAWKDLVGEDYMPDRWVAKTGRGLHLWFADWREWPTTKLAEKLDFKGVGGYVAAPPSMHPNGHRYEWLLPPSFIEPPMEMPAPLIAQLEAGQFARVRAKEDRAVKKLERSALNEDGMLVNTTSFAGIIERMKSAEPGERNNVLNWAAFTMVGDGASDADLQELAAAAQERGMPDREIVRTINSALDALND